MRFFLVFFVFGITGADRYAPLPDDALFISEIDILVWNETSPAGMQASALHAADKKWPNAKVPFRFDHSVSTDERKIVAEAMKEIHQKTCVRFHEALESDQDFVVIVKSPIRTCSSSVGWQGGQQQLYLAQGCYFQKTILHELMHALGFIHEHNRADREKYVTINWENIIERQELNFKKRIVEDLTLMDSPYSYDSIMHYGETFMSRDVRPTIVPKKQGVRLGGGDGLSPIDAKRINRYYGCQPVVQQTTSEPTKPMNPIPTKAVELWTTHNPWISTNLNDLMEKFRKDHFPRFDATFAPVGLNIQAAHVPESGSFSRSSHTVFSGNCGQRQGHGNEWNDGAFRFRCEPSGSTKFIGCLLNDGSVIPSGNIQRVGVLAIECKQNPNGSVTMRTV